MIIKIVSLICEYYVIVEIVPGHLVAVPISASFETEIVKEFYMFIPETYIEYFDAIIAQIK